MRHRAARVVCAALALAAGGPLLADCPPVGTRVFQVTNAYDIDGEPAPPLTLFVGSTYVFQLQNPSLHPFMLTYDENGGGGTSPLPTSTGVQCVCSGCGTCARQSISFTPAAHMANTVVYYQCTSHVVMGNSITILPRPTLTIQDQPGAAIGGCSGESFVLSVAAVSNEGQPLLYQWKRNGENLVEQPGRFVGTQSPSLTVSATITGDSGVYTCVITAPCKTATTSGTSVTIDDCTPVCPADLGGVGGAATPDGELDNNDFVVFIDWFFTADPRADIGGVGGDPAGDGQFDNNDFVVFIDRFFAGC